MTLATPITIDVPLHRDKDNVIRVGKTRVALRTVIADFHRGASPEEIVHHYPALTLSEVYLVIGYYLQNKEEIDAYIREQQALSDHARQEFESELQYTLRTKLLK